MSSSTINRIALELPSMRLREFSADGDGIATLVCAPLALHDATLTDFAPGHSSRCGSASSMLERGDLDQKLDRFVAM